MGITMRWLFTLLLLTIALTSHASTTASLHGKTIDKVLVVKSERTLHLMSRGDTTVLVRPIPAGSQR